MLLGVDVGGTFTDAVLVAGGTLHTAKAPTTSDDQSRAVMTAVRRALESAGASAADVESFAHGMTVATNALLEGKVARTAFVATAGFTDLVALGRQARRELYRLCAAHPAPLTPPERRFAARERTGPDGVLEELSDLDALVDAIAAAQPEAVAVCLLHSYRHPDHERAIGAALRERLGIHVSLSHEVVGTFREFERAATTEVDAALSPLLARYLRRLLDAARETGLPAPAIMQSSGGLAALDEAADHAALTVLSGPAGGAAAPALRAEGIVRVANAEMVRALRVMTVERGVDPRRFALLAFGGAGPLHAAAIADELGMTKILVPHASGVLSALGLAAADRRADAQRTVLGDEHDVEGLAAEVRTTLGGEPEIDVARDLRYHGQSHELTVRGGDEDLRERFEALHEERYGYRDPQGDVELVTVRVTGRLPAQPLRFGGESGRRVAGPEVVRLPEATLVVPEGWRGASDDTGTLI